MPIHKKMDKQIRVYPHKRSTILAVKKNPRRAPQNDMVISSIHSPRSKKKKKKAKKYLLYDTLCKKKKKKQMWENTHGYTVLWENKQKTSHPKRLIIHGDKGDGGRGGAGGVEGVTLLSIPFQITSGILKIHTNNQNQQGQRRNPERQYKQ